MHSGLLFEVGWQWSQDESDHFGLMNGGPNKGAGSVTDLSPSVRLETLLTTTITGDSVVKVA